MAGGEGVVTGALRRREQGLKSEGEQDNTELNKRNNGRVKGCKKNGVGKKKKDM